MILLQKVPLSRMMGFSSTVVRAGHTALAWGVSRDPDDGGEGCYVWQGDQECHIASLPSSELELPEALHGFCNCLPFLLLSFLFESPLPASFLSSSRSLIEASFLEKI